jgi:hypothetical protein
VARTHDPQLADLYRRLMVERGHCHTKTNCAAARKLVARTWVTITSGASYELRDLNGTPVTRREATKLTAALAVPDDIRCRATRHAAQQHRPGPYQLQAGIVACHAEAKDWTTTD